MRVIYMGSGAFGLPTVQALAAAHEVALVISQPDRTAGRGRQLRSTPIAAWALENDLPLERPKDVNDPELVARIHAVGADALIVIAFGQKLGEPLLEGLPAFNLHASLLPAYRGAAPINRAMMDGHARTGVSVIGLAQRMDAGTVFATADIPIDPGETAGELHDRLAELGPEVVLDVLAKLDAGALEGVVQDEALASKAPKLGRVDGTTGFTDSAALVRSRIHGLTPWPGCDILIDGKRLRLLRVRDHADHAGTEPPGTLLPDGLIACGSGAIQLLEVQPAGKKPMPFEAWQRGRQITPGVRAESIE